MKDRPAVRRCTSHAGRRPAALALVVSLLALAASVAPSSAAAASAGQLYAFGLNEYGQLGGTTNNGNSNPNPTPTLVTLPGAGGAVTEVAAGNQHSLAVTSTGQLYAFGYNYYGQLGIAANSGTPKPNPTPTLVTLPGATGPVTQVAAGYQHSLAVTSTGQLYAFGDNYYGQLGIAANSGTAKPNPTPTLVTLPGATGPVTQVAAGAWHSLALTSTGQLYAFGSNGEGQLGNTANNGTNNPNPTPTLVTLPGATGRVTQVAAGYQHSLALTSTGQLYAFGLNLYGQLGITAHSGAYEPNPTPTPVTLPGATGSVTRIAAGGYHSLALTSTGQLYAFGLNGEGQLGGTTNNGTDNPNPTPTLVTLPGATGSVTRIAAGSRHSLALTSTGQLYTFGENYFGQLGRTTNSGTEEPNPTPTVVDLGAGQTIDTMATGSNADHSLVVVADLSLTTAALPAGRVGTPYGATAGAAGGAPPYTWQASGLPAGLSIDPATGRITGTPGVAGTFAVTLRVTDGFGIVAAGVPIALTVAPVPVVPAEPVTPAPPAPEPVTPAPEPAAPAATTSRAATAVHLRAAPRHAAPGRRVRLVARVWGASPTGGVVFKDGKRRIGRAAVGADGRARITTRFLLADRRHRIRAIYSGDADNRRSTSAPLTLRVGRLLMPRLHYSPNTSHHPNPVGGPRYTFVFSGHGAAVGFRCRLDGHGWRRCTSPEVYRHLRRGRHVFRVRSVDRAGSLSPVRTVRFFAGRRQG